MMVAWLTMYMVQKPSKYDDVICEQPLTANIYLDTVSECVGLTIQYWHQVSTNKLSFSKQSFSSCVIIWLFHLEKEKMRILTVYKTVWSYTSTLSCSNLSGTKGVLEISNAKTIIFMRMSEVQP